MIWIKYLVIKKLNTILEREGNLLHLPDPVTVVGDIHGYYFCLDNNLDNFMIY